MNNFFLKKKSAIQKENKLPASSDIKTPNPNAMLVAIDDR